MKRALVFGSSPVQFSVGKTTYNYFGFLNVFSGKTVDEPTYRNNISPPFSGSENKSRKKST
jgi:hypothetical protein